MTFDPEVAQLAPLETAMVDILFTTDGLQGDLEGTATVAAADVLNSPQDVIVSVTVPEAEPAVLSAAALLMLFAMAGVPRRASGWRLRRAD